jgi:hypothetical protein
VLTFGDMPPPMAGPGEKGDKLGTIIVDCAS